MQIAQYINYEYNFFLSLQLEFIAARYNFSVYSTVDWN